MRQLLATLRRRPLPLIGTFVALTLAALLVTIVTIFLGTGLTLSVPAQRLAGTSAVVVTGNPNVQVHSGSGDKAETEVRPLPDYRRVPLGLANRLASVPGVASAVPDLSFQVALELANGKVATGTAAEPIEAHGWASVALTPFRISSGRAPIAAGEVVLGAGLAESMGLGPGSVVRLAGQDLPPFSVVGVAVSPTGNPSGNWTVFLSDAEAASLYGHPGQADLVGIVARPGVSAVTLAGASARPSQGSGLTVLSRRRSVNAEDLAAGVDKLGLVQIVQQGGVSIVATGFFVVAGTVALSVAMRWRNLALLRAVGSTPGQVGRMLALELAVLGILAGLVGYLPAVPLATWALRGLAAHQLLPPSPHAWTSPLVAPQAQEYCSPEIAGFVSVRRVSRIRPAAALAEATVEPRLIRPVRLLLGLCTLGGGAAMCALMIAVSLSVQLETTFALVAGTGASRVRRGVCSRSRTRSGRPSEDRRPTRGLLGSGTHPNNSLRARPR